MQMIEVIEEKKGWDTFISRFGEDNFSVKNDYMLRGQVACSIWVLLTEGKIDLIEGLDQIKSDKNVVFVLDRFKTGDVVYSEMSGTEKQVFARIYLVAETIMEVNKKISEFRKLLKVIDSNGKNMIFEWLKPFEPRDYTNS